MNTKYLLPVFYLPPISWFSLFLAEETEIIFEQFENFPKQTYRNRANIFGANGKLSLIIPINHTGQRTFKDIEISYREDWQKLHRKSVVTAYRSSPYFEFYEEKFEQIFSLKERFLLDHNLRCLEVLQNMLKTEKAYSLNSEYRREPEAQDFRNSFNAKTDFMGDQQHYYQVFEDREGFIKDLSVLDLLCNIGPESVTYLKKFNQ